MVQYKTFNNFLMEHKCNQKINLLEAKWYNAKKNYVTVYVLDRFTSYVHNGKDLPHPIPIFCIPPFVDQPCTILGY